MNNTTSPTVTSTAERPRAVLATVAVNHVTHDGFSESLPVLLPVWQVAFALSLTEAGLLNTAFVLAMALFQIPAGFLAERFGERIVMTAGTLVIGGAFVWLGNANGYLAIALALAVAGFGSATQHPLASALVARAFPMAGRRAALGIYNFSGDIGKVAFPVSLALLLTVGDWTRAVTVFGFVAIGVAIAMAILLAWTKAGGSHRNAEGKHAPPSGKGWGVTDRLGFSTLSTVFVIDTTVRSAFITLLPFLIVSKGIAVEEVGLFLSMLFIGGAVGKFACGILAERLGVVRTVLVTEVSTAVLIVATVFAPISASYVLFPLLGIALNGTSSALYGSVAEFTDPNRHARAFGLFYTLGIGIAAATPAIAGLAGDVMGLSTAIAISGALALVTLPLALMLRAPLAKASSLAMSVAVKTE
ncbi:MAG: MFS transporter [Rhodospirillaceae bacterium]|nr:MFS transporter [Rhodospirillaceae bacterium]